MIYLLIFLRLLHVFAGVFWVGAALLWTGFLEPASRGAGEAGAKFMRYFVGQTRVTTIMALAAIITSGSGLWLYWIVSNGLSVGWITSGPGLGFTIGTLASGLAFGWNLAVQRRTGPQMATIASRIQAANGPPDPQLLAELSDLQSQVRRVGLISAVLLSIAAIAMGVARYLVF